MNNTPSNEEYSIPMSRKLLIDQLIHIKGDRSLREYARSAGVSAAALSQILHGIYTPSRETLARLASVEANPEGEITVEELLRAAGYPEEEGGYRSKRAEQRAANYRQMELAVYGIIYQAFVERGISFELIQPGESGIDLLARCHDLPIEEWGFMLWNMPMARTLRQSPELSDIERSLFHMKPYVKRKISIVTNNRRRAECLLTWQDTISYSGELSVILFDDQTSRIVDEQYILHNACCGAEISLLDN